MQAKDYLRWIVDEAHTAVVATVDWEGRPVTCAIDMMDWDESGLYFLTAKGKSFYHRLMRKPFVSLSGMKGGDTLSTTAISVRGAVRSIGTKRLAEIFEKNPYMAKIYPTEKSREALEVFQLYKGQGEYFDLAQLPPYRQSFSFGGERIQENGYRIIPEKCIGCQGCRSVCPVNCISNTIPRSIDTAHCLHCGNCLSICPVGAVERIGAASQATK